MMFRIFYRLLPLLLLSAVVPACSGRDDGFQRGVVIPPEHYEVTDFACVSRIAKAHVDGVLVDQEQWWGRGRLTNRLSEWSPNYQIHYDATFEDGTTTIEGGGALIFPLAPGASDDFAFLVSSSGKTPVECTLVLHDSVLNH